MSIFIQNNIGKIYKVKISSIFKDYVYMEMVYTYIENAFHKEICLQAMDEKFKTKNDSIIDEINEIQYLMSSECNDCGHRFLHNNSSKNEICSLCEHKKAVLEQCIISENTYKFNSVAEYKELCDSLYLFKEDIEYESGILVTLSLNEDDKLYKVISKEVILNAFK